MRNIGASDQLPFFPVLRNFIVLYNFKPKQKINENFSFLTKICIPRILLFIFSFKNNLHLKNIDSHLQKKLNTCHIL